MVLSMRGLPGTTTIDARVLDTLAGGSLAMIGYLTLPTWERKRTRALLADLLDAQRALADAILRAYAAPSDEARSESSGAHRRVADTHGRRGIDRPNPPRAAPNSHDRRRTRASDSRGDAAVRAGKSGARERAGDAAPAGCAGDLARFRRCARRRMAELAWRCANRAAPPGDRSGRGPLQAKPSSPASNRQRAVYRRALARTSKRRAHCAPGRRPNQRYLRG